MQQEQITTIALFVRLLNYKNACKLIDFVNTIFDTGGKELAGVTVGGVFVVLTEEHWTEAITFLESLGVPYELTLEHPTKVNEAIVERLKANGTIV